MEVARIKDGIVVNVEVVDEDWLAEHGDDPEFTFVQANTGFDDLAFVGLGYDPVTGFEQPPSPVTLTPEEQAQYELETAEFEAALAAHLAAHPEEARVSGVSEA